MSEYQIGRVAVADTTLSPGTKMNVVALIASEGEKPLTILGEGILIGFNKRQQAIIKVEGRFGQSLIDACQEGVNHNYSARAQP